MQETITYRFNSFKHDNVGSISTLSKAVRGMRFGRQKIINAFNKLVPIEEYAQDEKEELIKWLWSQSELDEGPEKVLENKDFKNED